MQRRRSSMVITVLLTTGIGFLVQANPKICEDTSECARWGKDPITGQRECLVYKQKCRPAKCTRYCKDEKGGRFCCEYEESSGMSDDTLTPAILPTDGPSCEPEPVDTKSECAAKLASSSGCPSGCDACGASRYTDCCEQRTLKHGTTWVLCGAVKCTCPSACSR